MSDVVTPDPARLAAVRGVVGSHLARKKRFIKALFVVACLSEVGLFGAMLLFFDFSERLYWFVFFGLSLVYSPLITFVFRNSVIIDRLYYRLLYDLKYGELSPAGDDPRPEPDQNGNEAKDEVHSFLVKKERWSKILFIISGVFEAVFCVLMLCFMDFRNQLNWFLFFGFMAVYSPLIISAWRNAHLVDRVYYGLVDELRYRDGGE